MTPIYQTLYGPNDGNCFTASLATILGVPLNDIPHFCRDSKNNWCEDMQKWLNNRNQFAVIMAVPDDLTVKDIVPRGACLVGGDGGRGCKHEVVYVDGQLWHDPLPDGDGLVSVDDIIVIVPMDWTEMHNTGLKPDGAAVPEQGD